MLSYHAMQPRSPVVPYHNGAQTCPVLLHLAVLWGLHVTIVGELFNSAKMLAEQLLQSVSA